MISYTYEKDESGYKIIAHADDETKELFARFGVPIDITYKEVLDVLRMYPDMRARYEAVYSRLSRYDVGDLSRRFDTSPNGVTAVGFQNADHIKDILPILTIYAHSSKMIAMIMGWRSYGSDVGSIAAIANHAIVNEHVASIFNTFRVTRNATISISSEDGSSVELMVTNKPSDMGEEVARNAASARDIGNTVMTYVNGLRSQYANMQSELRARAEREINELKSKDIVETFKRVVEFSEAGWTVTKEEDGRFILEYPQKVYAEAVAVEKRRLLPDSGDTSLVILKLPEDLRKKLYVSSIRVVVNKTISGVTALGHHPHRLSRPKNTQAGLCVGDLDGKPISNIVKLPEALKTVYYQSMYSGSEVQDFVDKAAHDEAVISQVRGMSKPKSKSKDGQASLDGTPVAEPVQAPETPVAGSVFSVGTHFDTRRR